MSEKRIVVWCQHFADRPYLMLQWYDPVTNKRKSKSAETNNPHDAELKRADLEADLNHGRHKETSRITWEQFRELFEAEHVSGLREDTRGGYADTFKAFERLCNPTTMRTITERTISGFVGSLRRGKGIKGGPIQESTIKVRLQHLRTAFNWAARQKIIPECPAFPTIKPPKRKPQVVPVESFERMLAKAPDENMRVFLLAGWLAGLRLNEAIALEWEDTDAAPWVDFGRDRIIFPAGVVKAAEDQWVPLDPELREALEAMPRHGKRVFRFVEERNGKPIGDIAVSHRVTEVGRQAGVKLTMKSLRRGFGCYWASRVPAQVLQKLMRHSNISLTMAYYANIDDAAMGAVLGNKRNTPQQPIRNDVNRPGNVLRNSAPETRQTEQESNGASPGHHSDSV